MSYFKKTFMLTDKEKRIVSEMSGKIMLMVLQAQHMGYMSKELNLPPWEVESNIDEMLYVLRKHVGWKRYLKILFMK